MYKNGYLISGPHKAAKLYECSKCGGLIVDGTGTEIFHVSPPKKLEDISVFRNTLVFHKKCWMESTEKQDSERVDNSRSNHYQMDAFMWASGFGGLGDY